jgi:hypothetical protein
LGYFNSILDWVAGRFGYAKTSQERALALVGSPAARQSQYQINDALYDNTVYFPRSYGGALEDVLRLYLGLRNCDPNRYHVAGHFNPVREIVDCYLNILPGTWGTELKAVPVTPDATLNERLVDPLARIWRASLLDTEKSKLMRYGANLGTVGLRITARRDPQTAGGGRVAVEVQHPREIFDFTEDDQGNAIEVVLKYKKLLNRGTRTDPDYEAVDVVEELDKESFSRTYNGKQQLAAAERNNPFGFCPYVVHRHKDNGTAYGDWAYKGSERAIHHVNYRISRQDRSIDRNQFPNYFGSAGGPKPETVETDDDGTFFYVQATEGTPTPFLEAIAPKVDQGSSMKFWMELRDMLRGNQPELNLNDVKLIAGISGETLAQVLKPTEAAIRSVRPAYFHAVQRALQMAVSAGVVLGLWDVGTGTGSSGAADNAYKRGLEDFAFPELPPLPQSVYDRKNQAEAQVAEQLAKVNLANAAKTLPVSDDERLRLAGYTDDQIAEIKRERAQVDVVTQAKESNL